MNEHREPTADTMKKDTANMEMNVDLNTEKSAITTKMGHAETKTTADLSM